MQYLGTGKRHRMQKRKVVTRLLRKVYSKIFNLEAGGAALRFCQNISRHNNWHSMIYAKACLGTMEFSAMQYKMHRHYFFDVPFCWSREKCQQKLSDSWRNQKQLRKFVLAKKNISYCDFSDEKVKRYNRSCVLLYCLHGLGNVKEYELLTSCVRSGIELRWKNTCWTLACIKTIRPLCKLVYRNV